MNHGSLFSGIGGFDLAAERVGWRNVFQVEKDPYCTAVLTKNFPNVIKYGDIKGVDFTAFRGGIDVLSGGFPCQPFSHAGKQKGLDDDRYLWPEYDRAIEEIRPRWVIGENVIGIKNVALDLVCASLESKGYAVQPVVIPASAVGAWHRRERIWIIANDNREREFCETGRGEIGQRPRDGHQDAAHVDGPLVERYAGDEPIGPQGAQPHGRDGASYWSLYWIEVVAEFCRDHARLPSRMDRIKSLGNAIVPQVAQEIFQLINVIESR